MLEAILVLAVVISPQPAPVTWRLPATIETLRDVTIQRSQTPSGQGPQREVLVGRHKQRGLNDWQSDDPVVMAKGKRFLMVEMLPEGGCTIEFERRQFTLDSCWWLEGFRDHHEDVFKVVAGRRGR